MFNDVETVSCVVACLWLVFSNELRFLQDLQNNKQFVEGVNYAHPLRCLS
jgi:hypothetical protein